MAEGHPSRLMPRRRHDSLSKDLLSLWLTPLGRVESPRRVHGEERQIDVVLVAAPDGPEVRAYRQHLGLLGRMARGVSALEPFRNPFIDDELLACVVKRVELQQEGRRQARRSKEKVAVAVRTHLWVVTPTLSAVQRRRIGGRRRRGYPAGFFDLAEVFRTTVVVASRLPQTAETLWLRLLGRGKVQRRALDELNRLPVGHPLREPTAQRVLQWRREAEEEPTPSEADRELLMNTERWVAEWQQGIRREGEAKGKAEGKAQAVLSFLEARGLAVSEAQRARVLKCTDLEQLDGWVRKAATAKAAAELFAPPKRSAKGRR